MQTNLPLKISAVIAIPLALASLATGTAAAQEEPTFIATECGAGRLTECGLRTTFACEWSGKWMPWYTFPYMMYIPYKECVPTTNTLLFKNSARGEVEVFEPSS